MTSKAYDESVEARTNAAIQILGAPALLESYKEAGGKDTDLIAIRDSGRRAEAANLAQGGAKAQGKGATVDVLATFAQLQREYNAIMAVVRAVKGELDDEKAAPELIEKVEHVLANEAAVTVRTTALADGTKAKAREPSKSQEAVRAEIERDGKDLIALTEVHPQLAARRVDRPRLERLRDTAAGLAGKLAIRKVTKGSAKDRTKEEREAVAAQSKKWADIARVLDIAAGKNGAIANLVRAKGG